MQYINCWDQDFRSHKYTWAIFRGVLYEREVGRGIYTRAHLPGAPGRRTEMEACLTGEGKAMLTSREVRGEKPFREAERCWLCDGPTHTSFPLPRVKPRLTVTHPCSTGDSGREGGARERGREGRGRQRGRA